MAGASVTSAEQAFDLSPDEGIYGLGQHQEGAWNYVAPGSFKVQLAQSNTNVGVPVMTSSKGYVLLWDNPAVTTISSGHRGRRGQPSGSSLVIGVRQGD